jgi:hypothetical protein
MCGKCNKAIGLFNDNPILLQKAIEYLMFRKYQKVEKSDVVSQKGHDTIERELSKLGRTSAVDLSEEERRQVTDALDETEKS